MSQLALGWLMLNRDLWLEPDPVVRCSRLLAVESSKQVELFLMVTGLLEEQSAKILAGLGLPSLNRDLWWEPPHPYSRLLAAESLRVLGSSTMRAELFRLVLGGQLGGQTATSQVVLGEQTTMSQTASEEQIVATY
jgi:hypothetical protein